MPTWTDFFVRDSLQDDGSIPSPGYPCESPDIICTQQTIHAQPQQFFSGNYSSDPNLPVIANRQNYFYLRAKNKAAATKSCKVYLYWSAPSLLNTPDQWMTTDHTMYQLLSGGARQYFGTLTDVASEGIAAVEPPFIWNAPGVAHLCAVGVCWSDPNNPWTGPNVNTWQNFTTWVRTNQNVCWRNYDLIANRNLPALAPQVLLNNIYSTPMRTALDMTTQNLQGATVTVSCAAIPGFNTTQTITSNSQMFSTTLQNVPAKSQATITLGVQMPRNTPWPAGAGIMATAWVAAARSEPVARFANGIGADREHPLVIEAGRHMNAEAVLVSVGSYGFGYAG